MAWASGRSIMSKIVAQEDQGIYVYMVLHDYYTHIIYIYI